MADLTKEQRAAAKQQTADSTPATVNEPAQVDMYRDAPIHPEGPVCASVHEDEVERWAAQGWLVVPEAEA